MPIQLDNIPGRIAAWLTAAAPPGTAAASATVGPVAADPAEAALVAGAVTSRRHEFLTGRALARTALTQLEGPTTTIGVGDQRMPLWPDGFVGSITHSTGLCAVQVGRQNNLRTIGIDVERQGAVSEEIYQQIRAPGEPQLIHPDVATLVFSAKEAFYKAYYPSARTFLDFTDVALDIDWPAGCFTATLAAPKVPAVHGQRSLPGRFAWIGRFVATGVWLPA